ncbi:Lrp/AsnC family transcriptional regulator [Streptomyces sp. NPDC048473]|uniref:Lrp/AsnC family transcriptional regulator n=1 Tax=unclassified Streptomyces TaxID=2593676 RepID=UPI003717C798
MRTAEDEPLVAALERDGRATHPELQKATGRSESAIRRRMSQLTGSGAMYLDIEFDAEYFGFRGAAMLCITAAPRALNTVGEALATHQEVASAVATSGPSSLMAVTVTRNTAHLCRCLSDRFGMLDGVEHVETMPFLRRVKQLTYRPFRGWKPMGRQQGVLRRQRCGRRAPSGRPGGR